MALAVSIRRILAGASERRTTEIPQRWHGGITGDPRLKHPGNSDVHLDVSGTLQSRASQWNHKGPVSIDGALHVTQAITGQGGMTVSGGSGAEVEGSLRVRNGDVIAD